MHDVNDRLKITLIENYAPDAQQSMLKFGDLMAEILKEKGMDVERLAPLPVLMNSFMLRGLLGLKWIGYMDKYLIFPRRLSKYAKKNQNRVYHIVDHSNAVYEKQLRGCPLVITCHDLMAVASAKGEISQQKTGWTGKVLQAWILSHLKKIKYVICDSSKTQRDVLHFCTGGKMTQMMDVIHIALNGAFKAAEKVEVNSFLKLEAPTSQPYFFHVGGNQWYKNRPGVVELYARLIRMDEFKLHHLILAGKPWSIQLRDTVRKLNLETRVHEMINLPFDHLLKYYCGSESLLFMSLSEGYGWPILEAQACGTWVITSKREPMTEVGGEGACYIDPENMDESSQVIRKALYHKEEYIKKGYDNLRKYTRDKMITEYIEIYIRAFNGSQ
jgi:glycosyltransferase involved in cell wall biosynthesis